MTTKRNFKTAAILFAYESVQRQLSLGLTSFSASLCWDQLHSYSLLLP